MKPIRFLLIAVICILAGGGIALGQCVPPPSGMVAWYPLDEQNGATQVNDIAGFNNFGTPNPGSSVGPPNGPASVAGLVGAGALYFYTPYYVEVPTHSELDFGTGDFSIDAWVRAVGCGPGFLSPIVDKRDINTATGFMFYLEQTPAGTAFLKLQVNASTFTSTGSFPANAITWYHLAVTVQRATGPVVGTFYINGSPAGTFTPPAGTVTNTMLMWIGEIRIPGGRCEIAIDELELFNRALDSLEVYSIWHADSLGKCKPVGRNHYKTWRINDLNPALHTAFVKDQFMSDSLVLDTIDFLSNPARKDTFDIIGDTTDHLTWYRARGRDTLLQVEFENQFGKDTVLIDSVKYLLLPTQKFPHAPPESLDHYKGYKIRNPRTLFRQVQLQDQFDVGTVELIDSLVPTYFFTPARKNNDPVYDTTTHYLAYEIFPKQPFTQIRTTHDQFGVHDLSVRNSEILLVPTKKLMAGPSDVREIQGSDEVRPSQFSLSQNYPNPFNPFTNFQFTLSKSGQVKIEIFNVVGQKVKTLLDRDMRPGVYVADWDGKDEKGNPVSSGIYFYRMHAGDFSDMKKMVLLK